MSKFNKLSRAEMKNVLGGYVNPGCASNECSSDTDCTNAKWPHCYKSTCLETGATANFCGVNPS